MKKHFIFYASLFLILLFTSTACAAANQAILLNVNGAIGPAAEDYIQSGIDHAASQHARLLILKLDTPGGLATSMHNIDKAILASPIPVVTYVAPAGARAASAGTFILYASHIAAMAPGTNIGAASPVEIIPQPNSDPAAKNKIINDDLSTREHKTMNDASAYIRSLAALRDRNADWAENAVRNAASLPAAQALQQKVIDVIATNTPDLLQKINGRTVSVNGVSQTLDTGNLSVEEYQPNWRIQLLNILSDPNIAYILLLIGIYGLFFEFYNPGMVLPGVTGGIALLLALYAFQLLPVNYVGIALLLVGICFMIVEVLVSSFGIIGIGGIIAFVAGSILLLDVNSPGYHLAWSLIAAMTIFTVVFFSILILMSVRAMRRKVVSGREALIGSEGVVVEILNVNDLLIRVHGEIWKATASQPLQRNQKVIVTEVAGLILTVVPITMNKHFTKIE